MRALLTVRGLGLALSALLAAAGCSSSEEASPAERPAPKEAADGPNAEQPGEPPIGTTKSALAATPCRYIVPKSVEGTKVSCFDLTVKENRRAGAADKTIKIHLARIKGSPRSGTEGIPTIELIGGPGGGGDGLVGGIVAGAKELTDAYGPILAKGDLIVFDQRGVGRSLPRLGCPMPSDESAPEPTTKSCKEALEKQGIDLAAYDTIENAEDVHDMKVALGVDKIDLHGISYGTRLALEILKRHPDDVHAAIIDGVMPPDVPVMGMFPVAMDTILSRTFAACKADTKCNATYPDLDGQMTQLEEKLTKTPFKAHDYEYDMDYDYDWTAFVEDLIGRSYSEGTAAGVPYWIHSLLTQTQEQFTAAAKAADDAALAHYDEEDQAAKSNPLLAEYLAAMKRATQADYEAMGMAQGMYLSVTCNDYAQHEKIADARIALTKIRPVLRDERALEAEFGDCQVWPTRASEPTVQDPARFTGPVLVIGGDVDPATPVEWAKQAASTLPHHVFVEVPTGGHGQMDVCGAGLKAGFLTNPDAKVDATCATNRKFDWVYDTAGTKFHANRRIDAHTFVPTRPAANLADRLADRVLAGSKPAVVNQALKTIKALANRTR
ncbi:MAG: alpha/beta fold hydrolase [Labilithrix sp.]